MTTPAYQDNGVTVYLGDCLDVLPELADASVDSVVTDPPYGLEFMGKEWDAPWKDTHGNPLRSTQDARATKLGVQRGGADPFIGSGIRYGAGLPFQQWCQLWTTECLRILKPGGHLLAFGGTRTWHRLACAIEDAGFEIRDSIAWLYGSGFPKSLDVSKAIDKAAGAEREVVGRGSSGIAKGSDDRNFTHGKRAQLYDAQTEFDITAPATDAAKQWQGWGTALKPAHEPIVVARKPLSGTVAANVQTWGTGALNIDACRVQYATVGDRESAQALADLRAKGRRLGVLGEPGQGNSLAVSQTGDTRTGYEQTATHAAGRWPTNVVIDPHTAQGIDQQSGVSGGGIRCENVARQRNNGIGLGTADSRNGAANAPDNYGDQGGASRFFPTFKYEPKAPGTERPTVDGAAHPTVKPLDLMRWLIRLITPPHGLILDPFAGSGTTAEAAIHEHMQCITIEREADYLPVITARLHKPMQVGFDFEEELF